MGVSSDGILVFGFVVDDEGDAPVFMFDDEGEQIYDEFDDFLIDRELGLAGEDRKVVQDALKAYPLAMTIYCSYEYPCYILAIRGTETNVSRGSTKEIDPKEMVIPQEKIDFLKNFCEKYDIDYEEPKWLLASMYG